MRWDAQGLDVDDGALPGLERIGFVRSVRTPQFDGITFHEVLCKSALNKIPSAAALPFHYTVNGYRGMLARLPVLLCAAHPRVPGFQLQQRL